MERILKKIKDNKFYYIVFTMYALISFVMLFYHEQWRDEAQQWFIVKNLDFINVVKQMKYEGHFLLWYLILMPFAKLGFPILIQSIISWSISCVSVILILKKAPFSKFTKALLIFTTPFIYAYSVHSRVYCLILLSVVLCAITYKNRKEKPMLFMLSLVLLANTHIIMYGFLGIILLNFFMEIVKNKNLSKTDKIKYWKAFIVGFILILLTIFPLIGSLFVNKDLKLNETFSAFNIIYEPFKQVLFIYYCIANSYVVVGAILAIILFVIVFSMNLNKKCVLYVFVSLLWQWFVYIFVFGVNLQKAISIIPIIMFFVWTNRYEKNNTTFNSFDIKLLKVFSMTLLVLNVINSFIFIGYEVKYNYSSGKETAEFIENNIEDNSVMIVGDLPEACSSIMLYTNKVKFYSVQLDDYYTFITWNDDIRQKLDNNFIEDLDSKFDKNVNLYYVYVKGKVFKNNDKKLINNLVDTNKLEKVYESPGAIDREESYNIYKINR